MASNVRLALQPSLNYAFQSHALSGFEQTTQTAPTIIDTSTRPIKIVEAALDRGNAMGAVSLQDKSLETDVYELHSNSSAASKSILFPDVVRPIESPATTIERIKASDINIIAKVYDEHSPEIEKSRS